MARVPRRHIIYEGCTVHKVWRGHNKEYNLEQPEWKKRYLSILNHEIEKSDSEIQALTLMDNHTHELPRVGSTKGFSEWMRRHHAKYGMYFNRTNGRSGKVAEDRPKTVLAENDDAVLELILYIHANPFKSRMDRRRAENYQWSTHRLYAYGKRLPWMKNIKFAPSYMALGRTMKERQRAYRKMFAGYLADRGVADDTRVYERNFFWFSGVVSY